MLLYPRIHRKVLYEFLDGFSFELFTRDARNRPPAGVQFMHRSQFLPLGGRIDGGDDYSCPHTLSRSHSGKEHNSVWLEDAW